MSKPKPAPAPTPRKRPMPGIQAVKLLSGAGVKLISNVNRNWMGYTVLVVGLYVTTPLPMQVNDWPVARARMLEVITLPVTVADYLVNTLDLSRLHGQFKPLYGGDHEA